jgi:hypothetical protein
MHKYIKFLILCIILCFCGLAVLSVVSSAPETKQLIIHFTGDVATNGTGPPPTTPPIDWVAIFGGLSTILVGLIPMIKEWMEGRKWRKKYKEIGTPSTILHP